ncbi:DNA repair protein RecO [Sphingobacterium faecale]|uniref:DNA repair protein RecO n=1 Tax=Sphingobacterium faecale TaxID=2803775 RepID=A0ABS1R9Q8_9SPHI|nr:DNA repair protein RecO [Sphingobacterium faecale]MBL1411408.1 DNA repair protein RecO [Sphingobacterium faecale]
MLQKTKGIALKITYYSESSIVAHIFTENLGLQSYLINGARKPRAKIPINMLQPLHILDMVVYVKDGAILQRIKEAYPAPALKQVPLDIRKSAVALFLNEILYKVLKHQHADPHLFHFVFQSILWLDQTELSIHNFHLCFLMKLSRFLGYLPSSTGQSKPYFDLMEGCFINNLPAHGYVLQEPHTGLFHSILTCSYEDSPHISITHRDRIYILQQIVNFYRLHTENFGIVNSLEVLEEIFH